MSKQPHLTSAERSKLWGKGETVYPTCTCGMWQARGVQPWDHGQECPAVMSTGVPMADLDGWDLVNGLPPKELF